MRRHLVRLVAPICMSATLVALATPVQAQAVESGAAQSAAPSNAAASPSRRATAAPPLVERRIVTDADARRTADELNRVFETMPPGLRRVLQYDPSLLTNADYLAPYPALAAFLEQHPEVARNPSFFIGRPDEGQGTSDAVRIWNDFSQAVSVVVIIGMISGALLWLIHSLLEYRRWLRISRLNSDLQTKLVDRLSNSEELLAYIQTPLGLRLTEHATPQPQRQLTTVGAPLGRILWSVQAGFILASAGLGLLFVSRRVDVEVAQLMSVLGVLAVALGVGFILSAAAAWLLSKRLGLLNAQTRSGHDADAHGLPA